MKGEIYVVGVDLGGTNVRGAAVSDKGEILARVKLASQAMEGYGAVLARIVEVVDSITRNMGRPPAAVGLGSAGAIDYSGGIVTRSPNFPDWKDAPLGRDVEKRTGVPVALDNDANMAAVGEGWTGAAVEWTDYLTLTLGTGVGGGVVLGGGIWRGPTGMAGEIGHLPIRPGGRVCGCGAKGCLEAYASASGVARSARERLGEAGAVWLRENSGGPDKIDAELVTKGAENGDMLCREILEGAGRDLGVALASAALILDVSKFVIGGGMAGAFPLIEPAMRVSAIERAYTLNSEKLQIRKAALGDDAGMLGAAKTALESLCSG